MNHTMYFKAVVFTLSIFSSSAFSEVIALDNAGKINNPFVLELKEESEKLTISSHKPGLVYVKIRNILPHRKGDYLISIDQQVHDIPPFDRPEHISTPKPVEATADKRAPDIHEAESYRDALTQEQAQAFVKIHEHLKNICSLLKKKNQSILGIRQQIQFGKFLVEKNELKKVLDDVEPRLASVISDAREVFGTDAIVFDQLMKSQADKYKVETVCPDSIKLAKQIVSEKTELMASFYLNENVQAVLSVSLDGNQLALMEMSSSKRRWVTHIGFTFMSNKDESYFSKKVEDANGDISYHVQRKDTSGEINHSATIMFTYPHIDLGKGYMSGPSVGIGASNDSISVMAGWSLLINENFVLSFGAAFREFEKLSGTYYSKQDLGEEPVDSSNLVEKTYKATPMITFGYRFSQ